MTFGLPSVILRGFVKCKVLGKACVCVSTSFMERALEQEPSMVLLTQFEGSHRAHLHRDCLADRFRESFSAQTFDEHQDSSELETAISS
jgi:hypothetical protein